MRSFSMLLVVIGAVLVVTEPQARAAPASGPPPTTDGVSVGNMHRIIILPDDGKPVPAVRPVNRARGPAAPQAAPARPNPAPARSVVGGVPIQPTIDRTVERGARAGTPLPQP